MNTPRWNQVMSAAQHLTDSVHVSARITNLAIVAARAHLVANKGKAVLDGASLEAGMRQIALYPLPKLSKSAQLWNGLVNLLRASVSEKFSDRDLDAWVEAWQAADPGRKSRGAYATPSIFANELATGTVAPFVGSKCLVRVIDPSAGAGALLLAAYRALSAGKTETSRRKILRGLYGLEVDPVSRELCCLLLWLESGCHPDDLALIAGNVSVGEALGRNWWKDGGAPFDVLIMNPPWESLRHSIDEDAPHAAARAAAVKRLCEEKKSAPDLPPLYTAQGTGDRNLFKAFMELAPHLLTEGGRYGALVPSAFASDLGMSALRERYFQQLRIDTWTGFENIRKHFLIDSRYKFGLLVGSRCAEGTQSFRVRSFAADPHEVRAEHAQVTVSELARIGGPSRMIPELQDQEEKEILVCALASGRSFFSHGTFGKVVYKREVDLTMGLKKGQFVRFEDCAPLRAKADGTFVTSAAISYVPVMEGRMVGQYDVLQKSWIGGRGRTAQWRANGPMLLSDCRPQYVATPREDNGKVRIAICDVTSATNNRTVHATWVPSHWWCGNTAPVLEFENELYALAALGVLNSMVFDWLTRRIVGGLHLNKFYLDALAWPHFSESTLMDVARASATLCRQNKRFASAGGNRLLSTAGVHGNTITADPAVTIEIATARGFGLTGKMLTRMFNPSTMDRRGFWRYFASDHKATTVAESVLTHVALHEGELVSDGDIYRTGEHLPISQDTTLGTRIIQ
jgi:hypothetical protein